MSCYVTAADGPEAFGRIAGVRIKADPTESLHRFKQREIAAVFGRCPRKLFRRALELGAGDGYTSTLLAEYVQELICTDMNPRRLTGIDTDSVAFRILDAEEVGEQFSSGEFDLVYSSSLLEHLPDPGRALRGIHRILRDDGISIHLMPNRLWKGTTVLLYIPNRLLTSVEKLLIAATPSSGRTHSTRRPPYGGNNLKLARRKQSFLTKQFLPRTHGVSGNTLAEFLAFGKARWVHEFQLAGFRVLAVKRVAFSSGYRFGYERVRRVLERLGLYTVSAYILCKQDAQSPLATHLLP